jgi:hypothetical protein
MDAPGGANALIKGDFVCRPSWWIDVKFFVLNIGLHALTVKHGPGAGILHKTVNITNSILLPYSGIGSALATVGWRLVRYVEKHPLDVAKRAGALCMVQPGPYAPAQ